MTESGVKLLLKCFLLINLLNLLLVYFSLLKKISWTDRHF